MALSFEEWVTMTLLAAFDDFVTGSLGAVPGLLAKLNYVGALRNETGGYLHWGLDKVHGPAAAQRAIADAHTAVFLEVLRTPLAKLQAETGPESLKLLQGDAQLDAITPTSVEGGSKRHLNSVLEALRAVLTAQKKRNLAA